MALTGTAGIQVRVEDADVELALAVLTEAVSPTFTATFLSHDVKPYLQEQAEDHRLGRLERSSPGVRSEVQRLDRVVDPTPGVERDRALARQGVGDRAARHAGRFRHVSDGRHPLHPLLIEPVR